MKNPFDLYGKWWRGRVALTWRRYRLGFSQDFLTFYVGVSLTGELRLGFWSIDVCRVVPIATVTDTLTHAVWPRVGIDPGTFARWAEIENRTPPP